MEKRRLGKTGQLSTVLAFGGAAVGNVTQEEADRAIELALVEHGINHIDVAPSYGQAELRLGPWLQRHNKEVFLGCKTQARDKSSAWESIKHSLERLRVDHFTSSSFTRSMTWKRSILCLVLEVPWKQSSKLKSKGY
jgi:aryl-alcohol dehydrogenase-like predicted oxidoreductase